MHVTRTFETEILRSDLFAQVKLISVAPTLQDLRVCRRRRNGGKSKLPAKQRGSWPKVFWKLEEKCACLRQNLKPEEREFVVDSGASTHMISKKVLNSAEMDLDEVVSSYDSSTANGEVQTHEGATVYVKELVRFLTMKVLENTPAVVSLGKLCDENGYSYEWINGQKPHLNKAGFGCSATWRTSFPLWFQACQRVLPPVLILQPQWHLQDRRVIIPHLLKLVHFTKYNSNTRQWDSRKGRSEWDRFPSSACVKCKC